jgi:hypothetical protein
MANRWERWVKISLSLQTFGHALNGTVADAPGCQNFARSGLAARKRRCSEMESGMGLVVHFESRRRCHLIFCTGALLSLRCVMPIGIDKQLPIKSHQAS